MWVGWIPNQIRGMKMLYDSNWFGCAAAAVWTNNIKSNPTYAELFGSTSDQSTTIGFSSTRACSANPQSVTDSSCPSTLGLVPSKGVLCNTFSRSKYHSYTSHSPKQIRKIDPTIALYLHSFFNSQHKLLSVVVALPSLLSTSLSI